MAALFKAEGKAFPKRPEELWGERADMSIDAMLANAQRLVAAQEAEMARATKPIMSAEDQKSSRKDILRRIAERQKKP